MRSPHLREVSNTDTMLLEQPLPHDLAIERAILGSLLLDEKLIEQAIGLVRMKDFYLNSHRTIYEAMLGIREADSNVDPLLLQAKLTSMGKLEEIGGMAYIASLLDGAVRITNLSQHSKVLREKTRLREIILAANEMIAVAIDGESGREVIDHYQKQFSEMYQEPNEDGFESTGQLVFAQIDHLEKIAAGEIVYGMSTGFRDLDHFIGGLAVGNFVVVGAVSGTGKTSFGLCVGQNIANTGKTVALFSLEMTKAEITTRLLSMLSQVDSHRMRNGYMSRDEYAKLAQAMNHIDQHPIWIDDKAKKLTEIQAKARQFKLERGFLDLLIVDYAQLVSNEKKGQNREQEVASVSNGLKELAKELDCVVMALAQLNNDPNSNTDHRPQPWHLRESKTLFHDSDITLLIYREEMYKKTEENKGIAEIIIGKQRNGIAGECVKLAYLKQYTRFENLWRKN